MSSQKLTPSPQKISKLFRLLGQPSHLEILLAIGKGEACVCHLKAATGYRQAYISQHLMALRREGLVSFRRDGRNIYYRLINSSLLDVIFEAADVLGISTNTIIQNLLIEPLPNCTCPNCSAGKPHFSLNKNPNS